MNNQNKIRIRYFYDYGSGVCLWAGNNYTSELLGYPIESDCSYLKLHPQLVEEMEKLILLFDGSLNWSSPLDDSPWTEDEWTNFHQTSQTIFNKIRNSLPKEIDLIYEV